MAAWLPLALLAPLGNMRRFCAAFSVVAVALVPAVLAAAGAAPPPPDGGHPGWPVGWGFTSHGGFPPLPESWRSYSLQRATVGYFMVRASAHSSTRQQQLLTKCGLLLAAGCCVLLRHMTCWDVPFVHGRAMRVGWTQRRSCGRRRGSASSALAGSSTASQAITATWRCTSSRRLRGSRACHAAAVIIAGSSSGGSSNRRRAALTAATSFQAAFAAASRVQNWPTMRQLPPSLAVELECVNAHDRMVADPAWFPGGSRDDQGAADDHTRPFSVTAATPKVRPTRT
jgi:hypothetical protein